MNKLELISILKNQPESKDRGEGANQTQEIAVFQSREETERSSESVETNWSERNAGHETRFTGY